MPSDSCTIPSSWPRQEVGTTAAAGCMGRWGRVEGGVVQGGVGMSAVHNALLVPLLLVP